jgi:hypothetical protein
LLLLDAVGTEFGAEYSPVLEIVPVLLLPPTIPFTSQVIPVLDVPVTAAVNCCDPNVGTVTALGVTETPIPPWTMTLAAPDLDVSTFATAVTVIARGVVAAVDGAV